MSSQERYANSCDSKKSRPDGCWSEDATAANTVLLLAKMKSGSFSRKWQFCIGVFGGNALWIAVSGYFNKLLLSATFCYFLPHVATFFAYLVPN
ncbi:hypothetical protein [Flavipsychrobacter stenotrophus]|uniref:hypothetical protein n=1 Tax=Flavipsychrobacter stenotrophus TaxID=2077091 RepID=UPI001374E12A|nr:hypothetical protein [Flavipsychrobacter stenotrophus]